MVLSTSQLRNAWHPPCDQKMVTIKTASGAKITVDVRTAEAFRTLLAIFNKHNYVLRKTDTGAYNCRHINHNPNYGWSLHAYGIAADFNWGTNPWSGRYITDMPSAMVQEVLSIRTNKNNKRVFRWGGDWDYDSNTPHKYYDTMHYEIVCTPDDLSQGVYIRGSGERMDLYLNRGESGSHIENFQNLLNGVLLATGNKPGDELLIGVDGVWGERTSQALQHVIARMLTYDFHKLGNTPRPGRTMAADGQDKFSVVNLAWLGAVIAERELPVEENV